MKTLSSQTVIVVIFVALVSLSHASTQTSQNNRQLNREQPVTGSLRRTALVIGNSAYTNAPSLKNPANDARDMTVTLKALGFTVTSGIDLSQRDMKRLIREFGQKLKAGGSGLFYYAGHGVQSKGHNYLIPVDAEIQSEADVEDSGVDVALVLNYMDDAQNGLNIVILDACRNSPFGRSFRSASEGLAQVDAPTGTLIAYATAPGRVASDGTGQNGLYTAELLKQMHVPGLSVTDMFMRVRAEVMKQTANKQVPWEASSLVGAFYFSGDATNSSVSSSDSSKTPKPDPAAIEMSYWETIKNSTNPTDFKLYLNKYPNGMFSELAKLRSEATSSPGGPGLPSAEQLLGDYFTAIGGKEAIGRLTSLVRKGSYLVIQGNRKAEGEAEVYEKRPDKSHLLIKVGGGSSKEVYNGNIGWVWGSRTGTQAATAGNLESRQRSNAWDLGDVDVVKKLYSKLTVKERKKIDDHDVFVIEATFSGGKIDRIYIDAESKLLYRYDLITESVSVQQGIAFPTQVFLEDYIEINGVKIPMTIRQEQAGASATIKFDPLQIKFNVPLDEKLFTKP